MSKHTPGPWRWEFNKSAKSVYLVGGKPRFDKTVMQFARWGMGSAVPLFNSQITGDQYNIMERLCDMPAWTKPFQGLEHHAGWRMDVTHPDAVLMAAAPDLLEALKSTLLDLKAVDAAGQYGLELQPAIYQANQAIAKATGGES